MMILRALLLVLLTTPAVADTRSLTDRSDLLGWEAVGRIDIGDGGYCSGVLISPRYVLTAAHCLYEGNDRRDPSEMAFRAGFRDGETIASRPVARAAVLSGYDPADPDDGRHLANDIGLLELVDPIPATTASPFLVGRLPERGARVTALTYGRGRSNAMTRQRDCRVIARGSGIAAFSCNGQPGSSGGPIFDTSGRHPKIVSLISSGGPYKGQDAVFGAELTTAVKRLKYAFRTGDDVWPKGEVNARRVGMQERSAGSARFVKP